MNFLSTNRTSSFFSDPFINALSMKNVLARKPPYSFCIPDVAEANSTLVLNPNSFNIRITG